MRLMIVVAAVACMTAAVAAASPEVVQQLFVTHRHGARYPVPAVNMSGICPGGAANCGLLAPQGKVMLRHLGEYLRANYNSTLHPYDHYDPNVIHSRSTDVARTLQSGNALISGLYGHLQGTVNQAYPVMFSQEVDRDTELLVWDGWPALVLWSTATQAPFFAAVDAAILKIVNTSIMARIGVELGLSQECDPSLPGFFPFQCTIDAGDIYAYAIVSNTTAKYPITRSVFPQLEACLETYNKYAMGLFDQQTNGGRFLQSVGSFGYYLMMDVFANIDTPAWNSSAPSNGGRRLSHYSGHDITLIPLANTLGNFTMLNPRFGSAILLEVWGPANDFTKPKRVVAKFGTPSQAPEKNFEYTFESFALTCISSNGTTYRSAAGCPVEDLRRYVVSRGPQSPMGTCYASASTLSAISCTAAAPAASPSYCSYYRSMCIDACGSGYAMLPDLSCVATSHTADDRAPARLRQDASRSKRGSTKQRSPMRVS